MANEERNFNKSGKMRAFRPNGSNIEVFDWTNAIDIDQQTADQINRVSRLPFVKHIAVMPDAHYGMGATIGTVIGTQGALIPAAVGVDIGCGISAFNTGLEREALIGCEEAIYGMLKNAIPNGRTNNGAKGDRGAWGSTHSHAYQAMIDPFKSEYDRVIGMVEDWSEHLDVRHPFVDEHFGTLGTGNHFVELCEDENGIVWILVHSGSRGPGAKFAMHFMKAAKVLMQDFFVPLEDPDLSFIPSSLDLYYDYIGVVETMTEYARLNRYAMMSQAVGVLEDSNGYSALPNRFNMDTFVDTPHNFLRKERLLGKEMMITRKGASTARRGETVVIPGSMGTGSFIVEGKGNPLSLNSSSHGAGRRMSRTQARKTISVEDHIKSTQGVFCDKSEGVLDESPAAYKDINAVIEAQTDLIEVKHHLKAFVNMKGA